MWPPRGRTANPVTIFTSLSIQRRPPRQVPKTVQIREDDLTGTQIASFLGAHLENMHAITPPGRVHALSLEALRAPDIMFWSAWEGGELLGCGALKALDSTCGEIKSMRTAQAHQGRGIGSEILRHIVGEATRRAYHTLYLETGASAEFAPAHALYYRHGFEGCRPFDNYADDPNSVFMTKSLLPRE